MLCHPYDTPTFKIKAPQTLAQVIVQAVIRESSTASHSTATNELSYSFTIFTLNKPGFQHAIMKLNDVYTYAYAKQKYLGCKKGRDQKEPATKSFDIN